MKRFLLSIMLAIVVANANAQFKASINMSPGYSVSDCSVATFNYASVCKQLEVDPNEFFYILAYGQNNPNPEYTIYILTDDSGSKQKNYLGCNLTLDGKMAKSEEEARWYCLCPFLPEQNQMMFNIHPAERYIEGGYVPMLKEGDVCHAVFALEYKDKMATFDITVNVTENYGPLVDLNSMEKVGETVLSGKGYNEHGGLIEFYDRLNTEEIAALFDGDVQGSNLQLYLMAEPEKQMVFNASAYIPCSVSLNLDSNLRRDETSPFFNIVYSMNGAMRLNAFADYFKTSQKTSGSVFLVADSKYYEIKLDVQLGDEFDEKEGLDVVETVKQDVQLMWTQTYYTFQDMETGRWGLVSTDVNLDWAKKQLATENPLLYAERKEENGGIMYSNRYTAAPGQGFWLKNDGGQCYWNLWSSLNVLGVYYMSGTFLWYEQPYDKVLPGDKFLLNLYLANPETGKAVKYEIRVEIVKELQTESVAYVRNLPVGMGGNPDGIDRPLSGSPEGKRIGAMYDLQGRKLEKAPQKGIFIQNGKKIVK